MHNKLKRRFILYALCCILFTAAVTSVMQTRTEAASLNAKTASFLFIGNSQTYYNNLPGMFKSMAAADGKKINYRTLTYCGRTSKTHSYAIKAVLRTKGDVGKLKDGEKKYFSLYNSSEFNENVYRDYKAALFNSDGSLRRYDYIVVFERARCACERYQDWSSGVLSILQNLSTPKTNVIVYAPQAPWDKSEYLQRQDRTDQNAEKILKQINNKISCRSARIAYAGRAIVTYLSRNGLNAARKNASSNYTVYKKLSNDLILGDKIHLTQLGTYVAAAAVFSTVYNKNAAPTVNSYKASSRTGLWDIGSQKVRTNAVKHKGDFKGNKYLKAACSCAWSTIK